MVDFLLLGYTNIHKALKKSGLDPTFLFCNMVVIADVILTITMVTAASGAIAEFQLWIAYIGAATDSAFMVVYLLCSTAAGKLNGLSVGLLRCIVLFVSSSGRFYTPGKRQQIPHFTAKKEKIIQQTHQREQCVR